MPGLVRTGHFSSSQVFPVRSGWSEQDRSRRSNHVITVLVRSGQSSLVGLLRSGQIRFVSSDQDMSAPIRAVLVGQIRAGHVSLGQARLIRSH